MSSGRRDLGRLAYPSALAAVIALAAGLRLYHLGARGLWLDETYTAAAALVSGPELALQVAFSPDQAPVQFLLAWALRGIGLDEATLRLPAAVVGTLGLVGLYLLGRELVGRRVGLLAAALASVTPFLIWYSQEARNYSMVLAISPLQMLVAYRVAHRGRLRDWLLLVLITVAALYIHQLTGLTALAGFLYILWNVRHDAARRGLTLLSAIQAGLLVSVLYMPWLPVLVVFLRFNSGEDTRRLAGGYQPLPKAAELLGELGVGVPVALLLLLGAIVASRTLRPGFTLLAWWLGTFVATMALVAKGDLLDVWPRYFMQVWPALALLAAVGADCLLSAAGRMRWKVAPALTGAAMVVAVMAVDAPSLVHSYGLHKDQWREAAASIESSGSPLVMTMGRASDWETRYCLSFYFHRDGYPILLKDSHELPPGSGWLPKGSGPVWAAIANGYDPEGARARKLIASADFTNLAGVPADGVEVRQLIGVTLIRPSDGSGSVSDQVAILLRWGDRFQPGLAAQADALSASAGPLRT